MRVTLLSILMFCFSVLAHAEAITLYERSDTHTVNGLNAYQLQETNTNSDASTGEVRFNANTYIDSSIYVLHSDGSTTTIDSNIGSVHVTSEGYGHGTATWNCPETSLVSTDAIKVVTRIYNGVDPTKYATFVSEQLSSTKLEETTWTFDQWWFGRLIDPVHLIYAGSFVFGSSSHNSNISGIELSSSSGSYGFVI